MSTARDHAATRRPLDSGGRATWVYALCEPDGTPRYVGSTVRSESRLAEHVRDKASTAKTRWIRGLSAVGKAPRLVTLECVHGEERNRLEFRWIQRLRSRFSLVNSIVPSTRPSRRPPLPLPQHSFSDAEYERLLTSEPCSERFIGMVLARALRFALVQCGLDMREASKAMCVSLETVRRSIVNSEGSRCSSAVLRSPSLSRFYYEFVRIEIERADRGIGDAEDTVEVVVDLDFEETKGILQRLWRLEEKLSRRTA